jgi:ketosteroid isomerase-like protein
MSEENVEIVRRGYEAYELGDIDSAVADFAPECEYVAAGMVPGRTGAYLGPEGYKEFFSWLDEEFSDAHVQVDELLDAGDTVVVGATLRGRGRQSGLPGTFTFWQVWAVERGKIVRGQGFSDRTEALEAAGLSE